MPTKGDSGTFSDRNVDGRRSARPRGRHDHRGDRGGRDQGYIYLPPNILNAYRAFESRDPAAYQARYLSVMKTDG